MVSGGSTNSANAKSLKPVTARSSGTRRPARAGLTHHADREQVVAAHDRRRRIRQREQAVDHRPGVGRIPDALEQLERGVALEAGGRKRLAVAEVALLDHRPRLARRDERDPPVPAADQVIRQRPGAGAVVGGDRHLQLVAGERLLQDHRRHVQLGRARRVPGALVGRAGQEQQHAVDARLEHGLQEPAVGRAGPPGVNQHAVAAVARDVADAGDHLIRHRVGEIARAFVQQQEPDGRRACRAEAARGQVGVVAELLHRTLDPHPCLVGHLPEPVVDEVRDGLCRDSRVLGHIAHRRASAGGTLHRCHFT